MRTTIGGIFRPDRHAFFAKLTLSLLSQPGIKFRPAPLPRGGTGFRCQKMRKAAPHGSHSQAGIRGISRAGYKKIPRMRNGCETEA